MAEPLDEALEGLLKDYNEQVIRGLGQAGEAAIKRMASITRATAPVSFKYHDPHRPRFASSIRWRKEPYCLFGQTVFTWYVQKPNWWLTHLLENGHPMPNGGYAAATHFVRNAYYSVHFQYIADIKKAISEA